MTRSEIRFVRTGDKIALRLGKHGPRILEMLAVGDVELRFEDPQAVYTLGEEMKREAHEALKHQAKTEGQL